MKKRKSREFKDLVTNSQGQAVVEYVLILVVSLGLVLLVATQVFSPLQYFLKDFMGTYVQCLLDTGELPPLGGTNKIRDDSCTANWRKARQSAGLSSESQNSATNSAGGKSSSQDSNGSNAGFYAGSQSRQSPFFNSSRRNAGSAEGGSDGRRSVVIALENGGADQFFRLAQTVGSNMSSRTGRRVVSISDMSDDERKKLKKQDPKVPRIVASGENFSKVKQKFIVKPPPKKVFLENDDQPFSVGNLLRIFFIVAIIILLVLLVGGQALQLSKSWEK